MGSVVHVVGWRQRAVATLARAFEGRLPGQALVAIGRIALEDDELVERLQVGWI